MNTLNKKIAALGLGALLLGGSALWAHDDEPMDEAGSPEAMHKDKEHKGGKFKEELGLSEEQQTKMKEAGKAHQEAIKPLLEALKADREALKGLVEKKAADAEISAALAKLDADHQALEEAGKKHRETVKSILTPMQQA